MSKINPLMDGAFCAGCGEPPEEHRLHCVVVAAMAQGRESFRREVAEALDAEMAEAKKLPLGAAWYGDPCNGGSAYNLQSYFVKRARKLVDDVALPKPPPSSGGEGGGV